MTDYDARSWEALLQWREGRLTPRTRRALPAGVRARLSKTGQGAKEKFESLPGASQFESLFVKSLGGLADLGARTAMASIRHGAIMEVYRKQGHAVDSIED